MGTFNDHVAALAGAGGVTDKLAALAAGAAAGELGGPARSSAWYGAGYLQEGLLIPVNPTQINMLDTVDDFESDNSYVPSGEGGELISMVGLGGADPYWLLGADCILEFHTTLALNDNITGFSTVLVSFVPDRTGTATWPNLDFSYAPATLVVDTPRVWPVIPCLEGDKVRIKLARSSGTPSDDVYMMYATITAIAWEVEHA